MTNNELSQLPNSWSWSTLGEIGIVKAGGTPSTSKPENFNGEYPWITPADLTGYNGKFIGKGRKSLSGKGLNSSSAVLLPMGTVLFSSRAPIGYVVIAKNPVATNQGFKNLICHEGISNEYVFYYLKGSKKLAESYGSGTTFKEVSASRFAKIPIPISPTLEQHRIVGKVEELFSFLDAGVESLRKVQAQLKRYRQAVLKYAFEGKLTEDWRRTHKDQIETASHEFSSKINLPIGWSITQLDKVAEIQMGQSPPGSSYSEKCEGYPLLNGPTEFGVKNPNPRQWTTKPTRICRKGDLLICVRGNTTGRMNWADQQYCIGRGLASITPTENGAKASFVYYFLLKEVDEIMRRTTGSTFPNLKSTELKNFKLPLAPYLEQERITEMIEVAFSIAYETQKVLEQSLVQGNNLRQSILKDAFKGKLVPQDPSDEPAERLLERIKAERFHNGKVKSNEQLELSHYVK